MDEPTFSTDRHALDHRLVTIRTGPRDMLMRMSDGTMAHCQSGNQITVERWTLDALAPGDFEIIGTPAAPITDHAAP